MKKIILRISVGLVALLVLLAVGVTLHVRSKLPQREGQLTIEGLQAPVQVAFDERGVPHIKAANEPDLYRALGYVHAQDRLFQMELIRRLARGELSEVLGPKLLETDKLFRTLGLMEHARQTWPKMDQRSPAVVALQAYLAGVNAYQATHSRPLEFEILGISPRPFTPEDTLAISGYLAYSFAAAFRTEPVLSQVRDQLGAAYLKVFDLNWHEGGVLGQAPLAQLNWDGLQHLATVSDEAMRLTGTPLLEGSNAWAISGARTQSGKPLLAGDPHIGFSLPAVWYEAHLQSPGFELYGYFQALNPLALIGHNAQFAWSLTMFQNDDVDLIAEKVNPANPKQVWFKGDWVDLQERTERIAVKGQPAHELTLQRSPHGPILNPAFKESLGSTPVAMWWAFLETDNPILQAFYELNRADSLAKARQAASLIHSPGLNVVWAHANGDIGWWAAAKIPLRPDHVQASLILNGASTDADKNGFQDFALNPHEENPSRGYIVSANHQPASAQAVAGYYNLPDRGRRLDQVLSKPDIKWDTARAQALQLDNGFDYPRRVLEPLAADLSAAAQTDAQKLAIKDLLAWNGNHSIDSVSATLFNQFVYELLRAAMADELGDAAFGNLLRTRAVDHALPRLSADANSPWWDKRGTDARETRTAIVSEAWRNTISHLQSQYGADMASWTWGRAHTLTHKHPLGQQAPLDKIFNVGPFAAPGGHETPNNLSHVIGPAPWPVTYGPSTRRVVDLAQPQQAQGINPVGQSGVWPDAHYADQAPVYMAGKTAPQWLDVAGHIRSTLVLNPR